MSRLLEEIKTDLTFIRGHTLQPGWFKVLKVFILLAAIAGLYHWWGWPGPRPFSPSFSS